MTILDVSKQTILKAIKEETSFTNGAWSEFDGPYSIDEYGVNDEPKVADKKCQVCAVGAVLRNVLDPDLNYSAIETVATRAVNHNFKMEPAYFYDNNDVETDARNLIAKAENLKDDRLYLNALSVYYEGLCKVRKHLTNQDDLSRHQLYRIKKKLLKFIEKHFPKRLNIDIDGVKPKKGMKRVTS